MKNERKEELKDEMKNRISLALKDPILQQGFEIICKENAEIHQKIINLKKENVELEEWKEQTIKARGRDYMDWSRMKDDWNKMNDQLTIAKELLLELYGCIPSSMADSCKETLQKVALFFKDSEVEK